MEKEILAFIVSLFSPFLWMWFYIFFKKGRKWLVSFSALISSLFKGIITGGIIWGIRIIFQKMGEGMGGRVLGVFSASPEQMMTNLPFLIFSSLLSSYLFAFLESTLQNYFLKSDILKRNKVTKSMYGVEMGIFLGFGFSLVKNAFYISQMAPIRPLSEIVFFVLISSLAYVLFGSVLGYFLSLGKFHKLYQKEFFKNGFRVLFLLCGLLNFNFFLFNQIFYFTVWILIIVLGILAKYLIARRNFESKLIQREKVLPPLFYEKREIITFLVNESLSFYEMKQLAFCPNCFIIKEPEWHTCPYCGTRL